MMLSLGCGYGMVNGMFFGIERWFQKQMASYRSLMYGFVSRLDGSSQ